MSARLVRKLVRSVHAGWFRRLSASVAQGAARRRRSRTLRLLLELEPHRLEDLGLNRADLIAATRYGAEKAAFLERDQPVRLPGLTGLSRRP